MQRLTCSQVATALLASCNRLTGKLQPPYSQFATALLAICNRLTRIIPARGTQHFYGIAVVELLVGDGDLVRFGEM